MRGVAHGWAISAVPESFTAEKERGKEEIAG